MRETFHMQEASRFFVNAYYYVLKNLLCYLVKFF